MKNWQTAWVTLNGISFKKEAAIAMQRLDKPEYLRIMGYLARLRFWILQTPLNASSPEMVVVEHVQINDLRVWYGRCETDMVILQFSCGVPCGQPNTVRLLQHKEFPSRPAANGDLSLYGDNSPLARALMNWARTLTQSPTVTFQITRRNGRLQVALDQRPDSTRVWSADWTVPQWPDAKSALTLDARLLLDLNLRRNAGLSGAFRIWHQETSPLNLAQATDVSQGGAIDGMNTIPPQDVLLQLLSVPGSQPGADVTRADRPSLRDLAYRVDEEAHRQIAQTRAIMRSMERLCKGWTDGWELCLDAVQGKPTDIRYALSLEVVLRKRTVRRRWQGKVGSKQ